MFQRSGNQQITRLNADRLSVGVHLIKEQLDRLFETVGGERGRRSSHQILVTGMEQRTAVLLNRVLQKSAEEQLIDEPRRAVAHRHGDFHERAEVIVDDHLARQTEFLAVGVELVLGGFFNQPAVLDLAVRRNRQQIADVRQTEAVVFLEIVQIAGGTEFRCNYGLGFITLKQLFIRHIRENPRQRHTGESGADRFVVKTMRIR